ncbi:MAG TPA: MoxR family ATPase, partial [Polyangia bacterium]|nr:MoxR family ATPase [Polyangia bacterium]
MTITEFRDRFQRIHAEIARVVIGQDELIAQTLVAILARGHVLVEGAPGLGKTLLVRALGQVLGCVFKRIQFTPDLMPSDVTGGNAFNQKSSAFDFVPGPVFTQLLLADEINRAPAKTQSALLEAMQEHTVSVDGATRPLPKPFFVIATQNPIESQGTYPLPEAQLDRFLFKLFVHHPSPEVEKTILRSHLAGFDAVALERSALARVVGPADLIAMSEAITAVQVAEPLLDYITQIVARTRSHRSLIFGASPRASIALLQVSRVQAAVAGRDFVVPDDVKELAPAVLRHRVGLHPDAEIEGV